MKPDGSRQELPLKLGLEEVDPTPCRLRSAPPLQREGPGFGPIMSLEGDYSNYTAAQCFGLQDTEHQVACSAQHLNITNPPSIYGYEHYEQLWLSTACLLWNVTTGHRVTVHGTIARVALALGFLHPWRP